MDVLAKAIQSREAPEQIPMIFHERGVVVPKTSGEETEGFWAAIIEATLLPILAGFDFVLAMDTYMARDAEVRPSDNPESWPAVMYYTFVGGEITNTVYTKIHTTDAGAVVFEPAQELTDAQPTSPGFTALCWWVQYVHGNRGAMTEAELESFAASLARDGHLVIWVAEEATWTPSALN